MRSRNGSTGHKPASGWNVFRNLKQLVGLVDDLRACQDASVRRMERLEQNQDRTLALMKTVIESQARLTAVYKSGEEDRHEDVRGLDDRLQSMMQGTDSRFTALMDEHAGGVRTLQERLAEVLAANTSQSQAARERFDGLSQSQEAILSDLGRVSGEWMDRLQDMGAGVAQTVSVNVSESVSESVSATVSESVSATVSESVSATVSESVSATVSEAVSSNVTHAVCANVTDTISANVTDAMSANLSGLVAENIASALQGSNAASEERDNAVSTMLTELTEQVGRLNEMTQAFVPMNSQYFHTLSEARESIGNIDRMVGELYKLGLKELMEEIDSEDGEL